MHGFVNCVGLIDGTIFPLAFAPTLNTEKYFIRKGGYAIKGLVICDDVARKSLIEMVWLWHVYDHRVSSKSDVYLCKDKYFNHKQHLLGDSAFT